MLAHFFQAGSKSVGSLRFRFEQIITNIGARHINVGPDVVQYVIFREVMAADLIVTAAKVLEDTQGIDSGQRHNR